MCIVRRKICFDCSMSHMTRLAGVEERKGIVNGHLIDIYGREAGVNYSTRTLCGRASAWFFLVSGGPAKEDEQ